MVYKFNKGSSISGNAEEVYNAINDIGQKATPGEIVKKAKAEDSVLHSYFTWDEEKASYKWRCQEARQLVSSIIVVDDTEEEESDAPVIIRAFESVKDEDTKKRSYVKRETVIQSEEYLEDVRSEICTLVQSLLKRLKSYEDIPNMSRKVRALIRRTKAAMDDFR